MATAGTKFKEEKIPRRGKFELPVELPDGPSRVTWEFSTKDYDVGFEVRFFAASALKEEVVEPSRRVDCHDIPHHGRFESAEGGKVTLVWDNSFSRLRGKTLSYAVTVESTEGGSEGSGTIVRTAYGPGTLIEERADGISVVDLPFGRAYLRPSCVLKRFGGMHSPTTVAQLQRMELLRGRIRSASADNGLGTTAEEQAWLDDACLFRLLAGRGWDIDKALKLAEETLEWRFHSYRPQDLEFVDMMPLLHEFQVFIAGSDNDGRPVIVVKMDKPGCSLTPEDKLRVLVFVIEHTVTTMLKGDARQFVLFVDLAGFGRHHCGPKAIKLASICPGPLQKFYIGRMHKLVIFNTPLMFKALWGVASRLVSRDNESRILTLKGDSDAGALTTIKSMFPPATLMKMTAVHADFGLLKVKPAMPPAPPAAAAGGGGGGGGGGAAATPAPVASDASSGADTGSGTDAAVADVGASEEAGVVEDAAGTFIGDSGAVEGSADEAPPSEALEEGDDVEDGESAPADAAPVEEGDPDAGAEGEEGLVDVSI